MAKKNSTPSVLDDSKDVTITIRISTDWDSYINQSAAALSRKMDNKITKTWVVTQLMKMGRQPFEKKNGLKSRRADDKESA